MILPAYHPSNFPYRFCFIGFFCWLCSGLLLLFLSSCQTRPQPVLRSSTLVSQVDDSDDFILTRSDFSKLRLELARDGGLTIRTYRQLYMDTKDRNLHKLGYLLSVRIHASDRWLVFQRGTQSWSCRLIPDNLLLADIMAGRTVLAEIDDDLCQPEQGHIHPIVKLREVADHHLSAWSLELIAHSKSTVSSRNLQVGDELCGVSLIRTLYPQSYVGYRVVVRYPARADNIPAQFQDFLTKLGVSARTNSMASSDITNILTWPERGQESAKLVADEIIYRAR